MEHLGKGLARRTWRKDTGQSVLLIGWGEAQNWARRNWARCIRWKCYAPLTTRPLIALPRNPFTKWLPLALERDPHQVSSAHLSPSKETHKVYCRHRPKCHSVVDLRVTWQRARTGLTRSIRCSRWLRMCWGLWRRRKRRFWIWMLAIPQALKEIV